MTAMGTTRKCGASTNIVTEAVVRAPADGYTLLLGGAVNAVNATLYEKLNFNFITDIAPVAGVIQFPNVVDVNLSFAAKTVPRGHRRRNLYSLDRVSPRDSLEPTMKVNVRCPRTDKVLQISISDGDKTLALKWDQHIRYSCPHCGIMHTIKYRFAWVSGILDDLMRAS